MHLKKLLYLYDRKHKGSVGLKTLKEAPGFQLQVSEWKKYRYFLKYLFFLYFHIVTWRVFRKNYVFFSLSTAPRPCLVYISLQEIFNAMPEYSHSYWLANLANFCTTNSCPDLSRERRQNNANC